jgi:hypothetical protein
MNVVINAAWGSGYSRGQKRLIASLRSHGYEGDILTFDNVKINEHHDVNHPYTMKAAAFVEAIKKGYSNILWLDCSILATRDITPFFQLIREESAYFWQSGWRLSDSATDKDLEYAGFTRDQAEQMIECASGIVGLDMTNRDARRLFYTFLDANDHGVCSTSRLHANQSKDPRFKWGRQDQTAFTIAFHKTGFTRMYEAGQYSSYWEKDKKYSDSVYFLVKGGDFR